MATTSTDRKLKRKKQQTYLRVPSPFASRQAFVVVVVVNGRNLGSQTLVVVAAAIRVGQTIESLGCVEVELIPSDQMIQPEESLHFLQFRPRISDESLCVLHQH